VRLAVVFVAAGLCLARNSEDSVPDGIWHEVGRDQLALIKAPLKLKERKWIAAALPIAGGTAALVLTDTRAVRGLPNSAGRISVSNKVSQAGALYTLGAAVVGTALVARSKDKPEALRTSILAGRSLVSASVLTVAMKFAAGRERPFQNEEGRFWKAKNGFPSGHSMAIWSVAATVARRPNCPKWLKVTSYGAAIAVGAARVGARKHFPGDVFVGSSLGFLIGSRMARQP